MLFYKYLWISLSKQKVFIMHNWCMSLCVFDVSVVYEVIDVQLVTWYD